jgi:hypothetical protein
MTERQSSISGKSPDRISWAGRLAALGIAGMITAGFGILWAAEHQWIHLGPLLGVCGFKQRTGLPCPGCGWTHAAQAFVTGRIKDAFCLQPAAALFCLVAAVVVLFALQIAFLGVDSAPLRWARSPGGIKTLITAALIVILGGWLVTLAQAIMETGGS